MIDVYMWIGITTVGVVMKYLFFFSSLPRGFVNKWYKISVGVSIFLEFFCWFSWNECVIDVNMWIGKIMWLMLLLFIFSSLPRGFVNICCENFSWCWYYFLGNFRLALVEGLL